MMKRAPSKYLSKHMSVGPIENRNETVSKMYVRRFDNIAIEIYDNKKPVKIIKIVICGFCLISIKPRCVLTCNENQSQVTTLKFYISFKINRIPRLRKFPAKNVIFVLWFFDLD